MVILMALKERPYNRLLTSLYSLLALLMLSTYVLAFVFALSSFFGPEGVEFAAQSYKTIRLNLFYFGSLSVPIEARTWQIFLALNVLFALSFLSAFFTHERYFFAIKRLLFKGDEDALRKNFLVLMPAISSALLLVTTALNLIEEHAGVEVGGPSFNDPFSEIFTLSYSVLSEEVGFRLVPILVPLAAYLLFRSSNLLAGMPKRAKLILILVAVFKPESYQKKTDFQLDKAYRTLSILLIIISSVMFSYAHVLFGIWNWGKIPSTFVAGLVIGYCAVKYGFDSAILLHWFFNYYWSALSLYILLRCT